MVKSRKEHWEQLYRVRAPETMSWFEAEPATSLALLERAGLGQESAVIDVGGGTSTLVDHLVTRGVRRVTVLDVARAAIEAARTRLGNAATSVSWCEADVLTTSFPPAAYDLWHDRAVFHFLTAPDDRARYVAQLVHALRPGGGVIMATFAEDAPRRCSGLDVVRYTPQALASALGPAFELRETILDPHRTPSGATQPFLYTRWVHATA
jgi:SAM-dependent methyltransferase